MRPTDNDPGDLTRLTVEQAVALLQRRSAAQYVLACVVENSPPEERSSSSPDTLNRIAEVVVQKPWLFGKLVTFYYVGCAFTDGSRSLHEVRRMLKQRKKSPHAISTISSILTHLADHLFVDVFARASCSLIRSPEGGPALFSPEGKEAWEATRAFFLRQGCLPNWAPHGEAAT